uniref:Uncharacterized protein n=1 Tax=Micrurus lemniscatus lemniscatus TaxID=129467 RepID=A0A2D4IDH3_MICLE
MPSDTQKSSCWCRWLDRNPNYIPSGWLVYPRRPSREGLLIGFLGHPWLDRNPNHIPPVIPDTSFIPGDHLEKVFLLALLDVLGLIETQTTSHLSFQMPHLSKETISRRSSR